MGSLLFADMIPWAAVALNNKLCGFQPIVDPSTGKITGYKTDVGGADTVFPFSNAKKISLDLNLSCSNSYNFGDVNHVTCTILINENNSVSAQNTNIRYKATDSGGQTVDAVASLTNISVLSV